MSLSVIHLSDIHLKSSEDLILTRIDQLKSASISALPNNGNVIIVISGDIAFSGEKEQYDLAHDLLQKLTKYIEEQKSSNVYYAFVPGNHDCNFSESDSVREVLLRSPTPDIIDDTIYQAINKVQTSYTTFASIYDIDPSSMICKKEFEIDGNKLLMLLVNTAWMSVLHEVPGKIIIPSTFFPEIDASNYRIVFTIFHHPTSWLNPDYKNEFVNYVRHKSDILFIGHEHSRDSYHLIGDNFSIMCNHGKELQDSASAESAFSVITFDETYQNYELIDFVWQNNCYIRKNEKFNQFHKNIAAYDTVFHPNELMLQHMNDIGITINHFAKEHVTLSDLFIWPEFNKIDYNNDRTYDTRIRVNTFNELTNSSLNIIIGTATSGKSTLAQMLYLQYSTEEVCCVLANGSQFRSSENKNISEVIEDLFVNQYSDTQLENFRCLPKDKRVIVIDDFCTIKSIGNRRIHVLDYLSDYFGKVILFLSSEIELPSIVSAKAISSSVDFFYFELLPFGNKKRKELISRWYHLNETERDEAEIDERIDKSTSQVNTFLGLV